MINIYYHAFIIQILISLVYFHNHINWDDKIDFLILSIWVCDISNFISFDSNTIKWCNGLCFLIF